MLQAMLAVAGGAAAFAAPPAPPAPPSDAELHAYVERLWPDAAAHGVSRAVFDAAFATVTPDPSVAAMTRRQPEFVKPLGAYLDTQVTAGRVATGQAMLARWATDLATIEARSHVPPAVVVAVWGLETNYGTAAGRKDVIRSMATLGAMGIRPALYHDELLAALTLLQAGAVRRADLRGSWAGAMGLPQFMPSSFETYAISQQGAARPDIWDSVPDALASIANFLHAQGWQADRPWGFEVNLPAGLERRAGQADAHDWAGRGIVRADGAPMPASGAFTLYFPAGAIGPAFLVTPNFEVLKTYNFSDAYALSVAALADRMMGGGPVKARWPSAPPMAREDRIALQARLVALGYPVDDREGRIGLGLRTVIGTAQARLGLVPDGNPTAALLQALERASP